MKTFLQDLRYAARMLRRSPAFAAIAIGTLALGIGANTAIFSLVRAVLLEPLPFADADRVVNVMEVWKGNRGSVSAGMLADLQRDSRSFDRLAAARYSNMNLAVGDEAERVVAARVTHEFFSVFGVAPALGRVFRPEEDRPGGERVAVLSHRLWTARLGGAPDVLGRPLRLNGEVYTVVGIMPKAFDYARDNEELWIPAALTAEVLANHDNHNLVVTGLLRPGVTLAEAQAEASAIMVRIRKAYPQEASERDFRIQLMREVLVENYSDRLWILFGAVGLVLLIACINVSNMLLARGTLRQRELTVRSAVGASRARIARQLFTENLALGLVGGALGVLGGHGGRRGSDRGESRRRAPHRVGRSRRHRARLRAARLRRQRAPLRPRARRAGRPRRRCRPAFAKRAGGCAADRGTACGPSSWPDRSPSSCLCWPARASSSARRCTCSASIRVSIPAACSPRASLFRAPRTRIPAPSRALSKTWSKSWSDRRAWRRPR